MAQEFDDSEIGEEDFVDDLEIINAPADELVAKHEQIEYKSDNHSAKEQNVAIESVVNDCSQTKVEDIHLIEVVFMDLKLHLPNPTV